MYAGYTVVDPIEVGKIGMVVVETIVVEIVVVDMVMLAESMLSI